MRSLVFLLSTPQQLPPPSLSVSRLHCHPQHHSITAILLSILPLQPLLFTTSTTIFCKPMVLLELDQFLNELTVMFEHSSEKGSVWVTLKSSSLTSKVRRNKKLTSGEPIEYKCLVRATDGKMIISTTVGEGDQERFQASYAAILHAHMTALKKRDNKMDAEL